jgi:uncharacterized Zn-binding protein involved in type VI secretion
MPGIARQTDLVTATDTHIVLVPVGSGTVPTPLPFPFSGPITQGTSTDVLINGLPAATVDSVAINTPPHVPAPGPFQRPPSNRGVVITGSTTVLINGKGAARQGDVVRTCNDPQDAPVGTISAGSPDVTVS